MLHRTLPRPPAPPTLASGHRDSVLGYSEASVWRPGGHVAAGRVAMATPAQYTIHSGIQARGPPCLPPPHLYSLQGITDVGAYSPAKLRSKLNQIHCHVMLWLMMFICTIVCGVSNEFCIGKAVSLTKVPLPVLTEYLAGCPKCEV